MRTKGSRACARCGYPADGDACRQCGAPRGAGPNWGAEREGIAPRSRPGTQVRTVVVVVAIAAAVAAVWLMRSGRELTWPRPSSPLPFAGQAPRAPDAAPVAPATEPAAPDLAPVAPAAEPVVPAPPALADSARRLSAASAYASCGPALARAFFVGRHGAVTRAGAVCVGDPTLVVLADGRRMVGLRGHSDERADLATLRFLSDAPEGLPAGDSTLLSPGDPVWWSREPGGAASLREGRIVGVGRNVHGVVHLELDAVASRWEEGQPLLDSAGRVVGIVTAKERGGTGHGLALPIEYAQADDDRAPAPPERRARWRALLARVEREDRAEAARFSGRMVRPALLAARALPGAMLAVVVGKRFASATRPLRLQVEVRGGGRVLCSGVGVIDVWEPLEISLHGLLEGLPVEPQARWARDRGVGRGVHVGSTTVPLPACRSDAVLEGAEVTLRGGERSEVPVSFPRADFAAGEEAAPVVPAETPREARARAERRASLHRELGEARAAVERALATLDKSHDDVLADTTKVAAIPAAIDALSRARARYEAVQRKAREEGALRRAR